MIIARAGVLSVVGNETAEMMCGRRETAVSAVDSADAIKEKEMKGIKRHTVVQKKWSMHEIWSTPIPAPAPYRTFILGICGHHTGHSEKHEVNLNVHHHTRVTSRRSWPNRPDMQM
jgi:hypothetical protein